MRLKSKSYKISATIIAMLLAETSIAFADIVSPGPRPDNNPFTLDNFIYSLQGHPPTSERLTELGLVSADGIRGLAKELGLSPGARNLLWVISWDLYQVAQSSNITQGMTMQVYIIPGSSGELILEETYPDVSEVSSSLGYVRESYEYSLDFSPKAPGRYVQRFKVNGEYSNPITFHAKEASKSAT